jgi:hypothetical protein
VRVLIRLRGHDDPFCCHAPRPTTQIFFNQPVTRCLSHFLQDEGAITALNSFRREPSEKANHSVVRRTRSPNSRAVQKRGLITASAFMRSAIEKELVGSRNTSDSTEERLATIDRLAGELRRLRTGQQGLFAFLDALTKTVLTCLPRCPGPLDHPIRKAIIEIRRQSLCELEAEPRGSALFAE